MSLESIKSVIELKQIQTYTYEEQLFKEIHEIPKEYWPNLLKLIQVFRESLVLKTAEASFRQGWQEAMQGQTLPVSELWKDFDSE